MLAWPAGRGPGQHIWRAGPVRPANIYIYIYMGPGRPAMPAWPAGPAGRAQVGRPGHPIFIGEDAISEDGPCRVKVMNFNSKSLKKQ